MTIDVNVLRVSIMITIIAPGESLLSGCNIENEDEASVLAPGGFEPRVSPIQ